MPCSGGPELRRGPRGAVVIEQGDRVLSVEFATSGGPVLAMSGTWGTEPGRSCPDR